MGIESTTQVYWNEDEVRPGWSKKGASLKAGPATCLGGQVRSVFDPTNMRALH